MQQSYVSQLTAHSSQLTSAHSSQLTAHSSQLTAHSSQLTAHSSQTHDSQLTAHSSQLTAHSSQLTDSLTHSSVSSVSSQSRKALHSIIVCCYWFLLLFLLLTRLLQLQVTSLLPCLDLQLLSQIGCFAQRRSYLVLAPGCATACSTVVMRMLVYLRLLCWQWRSIWARAHHRLAPPI